MDKWVSISMNLKRVHKGRQYKATNKHEVQKKVPSLIHKRNYRSFTHMFSGKLNPVAFFKITF